jgi:hypothetical protein
MPRITEEESALYQSGSVGDWFQLKNHMEVARVQFMFDSIEEIPIFAVHKVKVGGKERYVNCLHHAGEPIDVCPFCAAGEKVLTVRFIVLFQHDDNKVKIWERGKQFIDKLKSQMSRYTPFSAQVYEIERHGQPNDTGTWYDLFHMDNVPAYDLTDVERPEFEGGLILEKTYEDMCAFLSTGNFPGETNSNPSVDSARRDTGRRVPSGTTPPPAQRTAPPATTAAPPAAPPAGVSRRAVAPQPAATQPATPPASAPTQTPPAQSSRRGAAAQEKF